MTYKTKGYLWETDGTSIQWTINKLKKHRLKIIYINNPGYKNF